MFSQPVYLIDTQAFRPHEKNRVIIERALSLWHKHGVLDDDQLAFQKKIASRSGLAADGTYLPDAIHPCLCKATPRTDLDSAMAECRLTTLGAVEGLLRKTGLVPSDIDIVVTTCSIFCPTPSMASMLVNHFKMRSDVLSYHLGGMGCSNGVVGINLVKDLLQANPNVNALFVTTEVTTPAYYAGRDRNRLVTNCIFRMGAAAALLSNKPSWGSHIKYQLMYNERVHVGQSDEAYTAIHYGPDADGINGIFLGKNVVSEASRALTKVMWKIGPKVLPLREKAKYAWAALAGALGLHTVPQYTPTFHGAVEHFAIHAGGAKVLDGLGQALKLTDDDLAPSRAVLHDYGNVSSSTTWYTVGYIESVKGVKRGETLMQIGVGSGIKCGINVWKATRDIDDAHEAWLSRIPEERLQKLIGPSDHNSPAPSQLTSQITIAVLLVCLIITLTLLATQLLAPRPIYIDSCFAAGRDTSPALSP